MFPISSAPSAPSAPAVDAELLDSLNAMVQTHDHSFRTLSIWHAVQDATDDQVLAIVNQGGSLGRQFGVATVTLTSPGQVVALTATAHHNRCVLVNNTTTSGGSLTLAATDFLANTIHTILVVNRSNEHGLTLVPTGGSEVVYYKGNQVNPSSGGQQSRIPRRGVAFIQQWGTNPDTGAPQFRVYIFP